jgi:hypothetical protein
MSILGFRSEQIFGDPRLILVLKLAAHLRRKGLFTPGIAPIAAP